MSAPSAPRGAQPLPFTPRVGLGIVYWILLLPPTWAAVALLLPDSTFAKSPGYDLMAHLMTENQWAAVSAATAAAAALAWGARNRHAVIVALFFVFLWHAIGAALALISFPLGLLPGPMVALAILICILIFRI